MSSAYKCDGCGNFYEGAAPVKADFRVWVTDEETDEGLKNGKVQQYCELRCFYEADKESIPEDMMQDLED